MITLTFTDLCMIVAIVCTILMWRASKAQHKAYKDMLESYETLQDKYELLIDKLTMGLDKGEIIITAIPRKEQAE